MKERWLGDKKRTCRHHKRCFVCGGVEEFLLTREFGSAWRGLGGRDL